MIPHLFRNVSLLCDFRGVGLHPRLRACYMSPPLQSHIGGDTCTKEKISIPLDICLLPPRVTESKKTMYCTKCSKLMSFWKGQLPNIVSYSSFCSRRNILMLGRATTSISPILNYFVFFLILIIMLPIHSLPFTCQKCDIKKIKMLFHVSVNYFCR